MIYETLRRVQLPLISDSVISYESMRPENSYIWFLIWSFFLGTHFVLFKTLRTERENNFEREN